MARAYAVRDITLILKLQSPSFGVTTAGITDGESKLSFHVIGWWFALVVSAGRVGPDVAFFVIRQTITIAIST